MTIQELADLLGALAKGSKIAVQGDEFGVLFPVGGPGLVHEARARAKYFAKARGCTFTFEDGTLTGIFTKI
jgi:hypothetical protein